MAIQVHLERVPHPPFYGFEIKVIPLRAERHKRFNLGERGGTADVDASDRGSGGGSGEGEVPEDGGGEEVNQDRACEAGQRPLSGE